MRRKLIIYWTYVTFSLSHLVCISFWLSNTSVNLLYGYAQTNVIVLTYTANKFLLGMFIYSALVDEIAKDFYSVWELFGHVLKMKYIESFKLNNVHVFFVFYTPKNIFIAQVTLLSKLFRFLKKWPFLPTTKLLLASFQLLFIVY